MPKTQKKTKSPELLSFTQIQSCLGIKSRKTILKYIQSGKLPAYKLGGTRWRIAADDMENFIKSQRILKDVSAVKNPPAEAVS